MTMLVHLVMFAWIPVILLLFVLLPPRRAVIVAFLAGWLFLPQAGYAFRGFPEYTKMSATCVGILLGGSLFDWHRITSFRLRWIDVPMVVWCMCPMFSSLSNGLGLYNGLSGVLGLTLSWGVPYFIGRVYFCDLDGLRELAVGIFIGGLIYVPLCLYEIRMSPQLHYIFYGRHARSFAGTRLGGYRPSVFMDTGLELGLWMTITSLTGVWLWASGAVKRLGGVPVSLLLALLLVTTVLCRSVGALFILLCGLVAMFSMKWTRLRAPIVALIAIAPVFMAVRAPGLWSGQQLVDAARVVAGEEPAGSLKIRFVNDDRLAEKALRRPVFGWGGWGRNRVYDERGRDISVTDGMWIQALGDNGLVGLISATLILLLPAAVLLWRYRPEAWCTPALAPAAVLATVVVLFMLDRLVNAMRNPIYIVAAGGIAGFCMISPAVVWRDVRNEVALLTTAHVGP